MEASKKIGIKQSLRRMLKGRRLKARYFSDLSELHALGWNYIYNMFSKIMA